VVATIVQQAMIPQPVYDPDLPPRALADLYAHPETQIPASVTPPRTGPPPIPISSVLAMGLAGVALCGALVVWSVTTAFTAIWLLLGLLSFTATIAKVSQRIQRRGDRASRAARLALVYHGRYLCIADFDEPAWTLLTRARRAVKVVLASQVNAEGRLGDLANAQVLPRYMWEIAQTLREQTLLRAEQTAAVKGVIVTPGLEAVLAPQRAALQRSADVTAEKVARLEDYARHVMRADAALRAHEQLGRNDRYRALLAQTGDESGLAELTGHADALRSALAQSVEEAIAAGRTLALPR